MKKIITIIITLILLCPLTAYAHSGDTDENKGHYDKEGNYHYHHGYPAHNHYNNTCPYNFNDNTDSSYDGRNDSTYYYDEEYYYRERPEDNYSKYQYHSSEKEYTSFLANIFKSEDSIVFFIILLYLCYSAFSYLFHIIIRYYPIRVKYCNSKIFSDNEVNDIITKLLAGESSFSIVNALEDVSFDNLNCAHKYIDGKDIYSVYVDKSTYSKNLFHSDPNCKHGLVSKYYLSVPEYYEPCPECNPIIPDTSWRVRLKEINRIRDKFHIKSNTTTNSTS